MTDVCEALRFVEPRSERGRKLEELLMKVKIPECGYLPLCRSTEPFQRVIKITPNEAKAFNTKVRWVDRSKREKNEGTPGIFAGQVETSLRV